MPERSALPQKLLLFSLNNQRPFAIGTLKVREITPYTRLTRLPHSHPAVLGTILFRGSAVPVIDMAAAVGGGPLSEEEKAKGAIIVTDVQRKEIGFLVRGVQRIVEANWKQVMPPPKSLGGHVFITGLINLEGEIIQLLDVELLLSKVYPDSVAPGQVALTDLQQETLRSQRILLVDDSQVARKQLSDALDSKGIPYQITANGQEALDMIKAASAEKRPVDILVSDIEMPGLDGYELTFNVRDQNDIHQPYIILHTSLNSEMSVSYARQVGADEAFTKFDAEELLQAMLRGAKQGGKT